MSHEMPPTEFRAKMWIHVVLLAIFGILGGFSLVMGPLFLLGILKPAHGGPGTDAGIGLTVASAFLLLVFFLAVFNIAARRRPLLGLTREGMEVNLIGVTALDSVPLIPGSVRVLWLILSFQGFRQQILRVSWQSLGETRITGLPMSRWLTIQGMFIHRHAETDARRVGEVAFRDVNFRVPLEQVAQAIYTYHARADLRERLTSWG